MRNVRMTICVMLAFCAAYFLGLPGTIAMVVYDFGGEHDIDFVINDFVVVKNSASNVPTTVNLLPNGSVVWMEVGDTSQVNIAGGSMFGYFSASDDSRVAFSSGEVGQTFRVGRNSQITITGGSIADDIITSGNSQLSIFGGTIGDILDVSQQSVVTIHGSNFNYGYGGITNSTGILTGMLANGDPINNRFYVHDNASIILVPEPSTLLLLGLGAVMLRKRRSS